MISHKYRYALPLVLGTLGCAMASPEQVAAQTYQCVTATNERAAAIQSFIVGAVTGTDTTAIADRAQYQLPQATASKVAYVTQTNTCRTAAQNFYTAVGVAPPTSGTELVLVLKVSNNRYVVSVFSHRVGEWGATVTFDSKWHRLAMVAG